ncbi:MAG: filamentous hemagglutinin N-terminal domain-containing protein, partial [Planctomycetaceae bacterium]
MSEQRPKREPLSIEEATVSNIWEIPPLWKCSNGRAGFFTMDESTARSRHPDFIRQAFLWALLPTLLLVLNAPDPTYAQVATNITSTTGAGNLGTTVTQAGNLYDITGGTRPGNGPNLFHSFGDFTVGGGDIANFLNNTQLPTSNILGRVTGGNPSNIFGTIQTTDFGAANLYLINPAGVIFGPTASLNVGGSVAASTADYLKMTDDAKFYANPAQTSVLSIAPVAAFGFLRPNGGISIQGGVDSPALLPSTRTDVSLVGGDITITGRNLATAGGHINLTSVRPEGGGEVALTSGQPAVVSGVSTFGDIVLSNARLDTSADAAGPVFLRGGRLIMTDSSEIRAHSVDGTGGAATARILVHAQNISVNGGGMETSTSGTQPGGDILMNGEQITLTNTLIASASTSSATNAGRAGTIIVQGIAGPGSPATRVSLATTSEISTAINGGSADITPSNITITTETLELADVAQIQANTTGATS